MTDGCRKLFNDSFGPNFINDINVIVDNLLSDYVVGAVSSDPQHVTERDMAKSWWIQMELKALKRLKLA
jgi:hypothetical protein